MLQRSQGLHHPDGGGIPSIGVFHIARKYAVGNKAELLVQCKGGFVVRDHFRFGLFKSCGIKELGAVRAVCFDMNAACSGFLFAYQTAQAYIASGICRNILITGSERLSGIVDWKDRGTCILFGDGAGAALIRAKEGKQYLPFACSDGTGGPALTCPGYAGKQDGDQKVISHISMDGREVFQFAVRRVPFTSTLRFLILNSCKS